MNTNHNSLRTALRVTVAAIAVAGLLSGCGVEGESMTNVEIETQPGMIASAIEPSTGHAIDINVDITAPATIENAALRPASELIVIPTGDPQILPPGLEEVVLPEGEESPAERQPFENGCGSRDDWKALAHNRCDATDTRLNDTVFHGECDGGYTSTKFSCESIEEDTTAPNTTHEALTIGGAGTCKPLSALKSAALIFCASHDYEVGKALQPCDGGIESDEDMYRVFVFTCRR
jgi:hypothetical protein